MRLFIAEKPNLGQSIAQLLQLAICRNALLALTAAACGFAWGHQSLSFLIVLAVAVPLLWGMAGNRWAAGAIALSYYLAASHGLPLGVGLFFAESAPGWFGWALWAAVGLVNGALWAAFWHGTKRRRAWGAVAAIAVTALPPVGLVGWANPLTASGWLFPNMGFVGLTLTGGLAAALAIRHWPVIGMLAGAALVANISASVWPKSHALGLTSWSAQDTQFQRLQSGSVGQLNVRVQFVMDLAQRLQPGQVVVLPETVLPANKPAVSFAWLLMGDVAEQLKAKGATILVGTELSKPGRATENVLVVLGDDAAKPLVQRVPVPIGMWRPWDKETFAADPLSSGVGQLRGHQVAFSICYEQLLVFPVLFSMARSPDVLVGAANVWWARNTNIPTIQGQALDAWGRLFGVPVVRATNQ